MSKEKLKMGQDKTVDKMTSLLLAQSSILREVLDSKKLNGREKEIMAMIGSLLSNTSAVASLARDRQMFLNEIYILSAAFFERLIAVYYLLHCPDHEFYDYRDHIKFRMYKSLDRSFNAGELKLNINYKGVSKSGMEDYRELKKKFKKRRNRWSELTLEEMLDFLQNNTSLHVHLLLLFQGVIYSDAAEARHGSFYGATFHTGAYDPSLNKSSKDDIHERCNAYASLLLMMMGIFIDQLLRILGEKSDIKKYIEASMKNTENATQVLKDILEKNKQPTQPLK